LVSPGRSTAGPPSRPLRLLEDGERPDAFGSRPSAPTQISPLPIPRSKQAQGGMCTGVRRRRHGAPTCSLPGKCDQKGLRLVVSAACQRLSPLFDSPREDHGLYGRPRSRMHLPSPARMCHPHKHTPPKCSQLHRDCRRTHNTLIEGARCMLAPFQGAPHPVPSVEQSMYGCSAGQTPLQEGGRAEVFPSLGVGLSAGVTCWRFMRLVG
jgi:hypothetical protein